MKQTILSAGFDLFTVKHGTPTVCAQQNLDGRSFWARADSLRFHYAKIHKCEILRDGVILGVLASTAVGMDETDPRVYSSTFFDPAGRVIEGPWEREVRERAPKIETAAREFRTICESFDFGPSIRVFLARELRAAEMRAESIRAALKEL